MNKYQYNIHANPDSIPVKYSNWYPPIKVTEKNTDYAQLLMPDLASAVSEMTTVHQYLFQSWTINNEYGNIRRIIKRIAVVEEHHFSVIGQLIALLGGQPECRSSESKSFWCVDMVDYSPDIYTILAVNAKSEKFAAKAYLEQSREIKDPLVSKMLARLALDEKLHYNIFSDFLSQI